MNHSTPGLPVHPNSRSSLRLTSIKSVMPSSHLILCRPLLLLPSIPPSIRVFSYESTFHMRWPKYWSFSFSIIPSKEIPGLISFRMDRLDLLAVQGTLKSLLQHYSPEQGYYWWLKGTKLCWRTVVNVPGLNFKLISVSLNVFPCFIGSCFLVCEKNVTISIDSGKMIVISVQCHIPVLCFNYF